MARPPLPAGGDQPDSALEFSIGNVAAGSKFMAFFSSLVFGRLSPFYITPLPGVGPAAAKNWFGFAHGDGSIGEKVTGEHLSDAGTDEFHSPPALREPLLIGGKSSKIFIIFKSFCSSDN